MKRSGSATRYPGVLRVAEKLFRVRGFVVDPRTGRRREIDRVIKAASVHEAKRAREEMLLKEEQAVEPVTRVRVGEYAQSWMRSKALKLDGATARTYADALEQHILPRLGDLFYDAVTGRDVQTWVDDAILNGWKTKRGVKKRYSPWSVHAWFRVFRAMTRDAMHELGLERDPTLRVSFPVAEEKMDPNCLEPEELAAFLAAMRAEFPHHWGLSVLLAYTGLRFCHASALRWEDWDRDRGLIRVLRKQVRGKVAPVTRKKQAPRGDPGRAGTGGRARRAPGDAAGRPGARAGGRVDVPVVSRNAARAEQPLQRVAPLHGGDGHRAAVHGPWHAVHVHRSGAASERRRRGSAGTHRPCHGADAAPLLARRATTKSGLLSRAFCASSRPLPARVPPKSVGTLVGTDRPERADQHKGRLATGAKRPQSFERDTGVEPATFSLGS